MGSVFDHATLTFELDFGHEKQTFCSATLIHVSSTTLTSCSEDSTHTLFLSQRMLSSLHFNFAVKQYCSYSQSYLSTQSSKVTNTTTVTDVSDLLSVAFSAMLIVRCNDLSASLYEEFLRNALSTVRASVTPSLDETIG